MRGTANAVAYEPHETHYCNWFIILNINLLKPTGYVMHQ